MKSVVNQNLKNKAFSERGAGMVEYALLIAMGALLIAGGVRSVGEKASAVFNQAGNMAACGGGGEDECSAPPTQPGL